MRRQGRRERSGAPRIVQCTSVLVSDRSGAERHAGLPGGRATSRDIRARDCGFEALCPKPPRERPPPDDRPNRRRKEGGRLRRPHPRVPWRRPCPTYAPSSTSSPPRSPTKSSPPSRPLRSTNWSAPKTPGAPRATVVQREPRKSRHPCRPHPPSRLPGIPDAFLVDWQNEIAATLDKIVLLVKTRKNGMRAEEIRSKLGMIPKEMPRILKEGLAKKKLTSKGNKRATTHFAK